MDTLAVLLRGPGDLGLQRVALTAPDPGDLVVDVQWSGISTGTERLLYSGRMPPFPGMGYPLVPGYETVAVVYEAGADARHRVGDVVFVPGSRCFKDVHALFGGAAKRLIVAEDRVVTVDPAHNEQSVLLALAATAHHAIVGGAPPDLIVGHGVLGRLIARISLALGYPPPVIWEVDPARREGAAGYRVVDPGSDSEGRYRTIVDVSGDAGIFDTLVGRLKPQGEIVLAGFYSDRVSFAFPPAFMREARFRVAAQWQPDDLAAVAGLAASGELSLDGLITHCAPAGEAGAAYEQAFSDPACLKMVLDWRGQTS